MSGFTGVTGGDMKFVEQNDRATMQTKRYKDKTLCAEARLLLKFEKDSVFYETSGYLVVISGVVLNLHLLKKKYYAAHTGELCLLMMAVHGDSFAHHLRGSFSGMVWDKKRERLLLFTDHTGSKPLFYAGNDSLFFFASELTGLTDLMRHNHFDYHLNETSAFQMVTYGFLLEDFTIIQEAKKLTAGQYLVSEAGECQTYFYNHFFYLPDNAMTESEMIETADALFLQAVQRVTDKNREYGYENFIPLSAGMDSRMVTYAARKLTDKPAYNFTYSQTGFYDETTAEKIIESIHNHWIFKPGNDGFSLFDVDGPVRINQGLLSYYGAAVVNDLFSQLNYCNMGVILTGLRGSGTISTCNAGLLDKNTVFTDAFSTRLSPHLLHRLDMDGLHRKYIYLELFSLYNAGFGGFNMGSPLVFAQHTESYSPFLDVDFLEFSLTIPFEMRYNNRLYDAWMIEKYHDATQFLHNGNRYIGGEKRYRQKPVIHVGKRYYSLRDLPRLSVVYLLRQCGLCPKIAGDGGFDSCHNVAPIGYWYFTNERLKAHLDLYFDHHINRLLHYPELYEECSRLYLTGNGIEKNMVLTLLSVVGLLFGDSDV